ncbi:PTS fructose transporter subunit IIB [Paenibacillus terrae]|uniref:PTS EIIB type-2 domain-containing protein n=1 Tax=Paenibacillus terrae TaxID=159743 RepID=A0A0D7X2J7_9BACL|nr:PTS fructose transporter subunit IIB [Paenibacillus terrae]KJD45203.1 hypothetical protein QD47_13110 [Paenibacillus terrae]
MNIVGITACPTGIAHTYMAQSALLKKAKELGHSISIETQGAMGIESELSKKDIAAADVVILAVGCAVDKLERFEGKPVLKVEIKDAISKSAQVISDAEQLAKQQ